MRTLLMATVGQVFESIVEAEPVMVDTDAVTVTFELDTGERIMFDRQELALALTDRKQAAA